MFFQFFFKLHDDPFLVLPLALCFLGIVAKDVASSAPLHPRPFDLEVIGNGPEGDFI